MNRRGAPADTRHCIRPVGIGGFVSAMSLRLVTFSTWGRQQQYTQRVAAEARSVLRESSTRLKDVSNLFLFYEDPGPERGEGDQG
jgi:hypothetical protein